MLKDKRYLYWDILILIIIGLTPLLWFKSGFMINGGDTNFPLDPLSWFSNRFYLWNSQYNAGLEYYYAPGGIFFHALQTIIYSIGFSLIATEKIFVVLWFMAIAFSMYFLMTVLENRKPDRVARLTAVIFYCYNLYLMNPWAQIQSANLSAYVAAPIILALFIKGLRREIAYFKAAILIGFASIIGSAAGINPPMFLVVIFIMAIYYGYFLLYKDIGWQAKKKSFSFCFMIIAMFLLLNAYWLLPELSEIIRKIFASGTDITTFGVVNWLAGVSRKTSIINVARMMGAWDWYDGWAGESYVPYAQVYFTRSFFIIFGIFSVIFIYSSVFLVKNRYKFYLLILAVVGTLFSTGSHPPFGVIYLWIARHVPLFSIFRSPWYKFSLMVALGYAALAGLTASVIFYWLAGKRKILRISAIFFIFFLILAKLIYSFPFFTGEIIVTHKNLPSLLMKIPNYVFDSGKWINKNVGDYRILSMPQGYDNYKWGWGSTTHIVSLLSKKPVFWGNIGSEPTLKLRELCYEAIYKQSTPYAYKILGLLSAKYILQRNDAWFDIQGGTDSPEFIKSRLNFQKDINKIKSLGQWDFYEVKNALPRIYTASNISLITGDIESLVPLSNTVFLDENPCFAFSHQQIPESILKWKGFNKLFLYDSGINDFMLEFLNKEHSCTLDTIEEPLKMSVEKEDIYHIWIKNAKLPHLKEISFLVGEKEFKFSNKDIRGFEKDLPMLNYKPLGRLFLPAGQNRIYITQGLKKKEAHEFLIISDSKLKDLKIQLMHFVNLPDARISFLISDKCMKTDTFKAIKGGDLKVYFNEGFHRPEVRGNKKTWRWLKTQFIDNIVIENNTSDSLYTNLRFTTYSFHRMRNLYLYLNGDLLHYPPIEPNVDTIIDLENIKLKPGKNILSFYTPFGSDNIDEIMTNGDFRDVTFAFKDDFRLGNYVFSGNVFVPRDQRYKIKLYPHCPVTTKTSFSSEKRINFAGRKLILKLRADGQSYSCDDVLDLKKGLYEYSIEQDNIEKYFLNFRPKTFLRTNK